MLNVKPFSSRKGFFSGKMTMMLTLQHKLIASRNFETIALTRRNKFKRKQISQVWAEQMTMSDEFSSLMHFMFALEYYN